MWILPKLQAAIASQSEVSGSDGKRETLIRDAARLTGKEVRNNSYSFSREKGKGRGEGGEKGTCWR